MKRLMYSFILVLLLFCIKTNILFSSNWVLSSSKYPDKTIYYYTKKVTWIDYSVTIDNVPSYIWHHGCAPTSLGMLIGYWDNMEYNLFDGDPVIQELVNSDIASEQHYEDYALPLDYKYLNISPLPDKSEQPIGDEHINNCIADHLQASQSAQRLFYGWAWFSKVEAGIEDYINTKEPRFNFDAQTISWPTWEQLKYEIDHNRPVAIIVNTQVGYPNHLMVVYGYTETPSRMYKSYTTWYDKGLWFDFETGNINDPYSVWGMITLKLWHNVYFPII